FSMRCPEKTMVCRSRVDRWPSRSPYLRTGSPSPLCLPASLALAWAERRAGATGSRGDVLVGEGELGERLAQVPGEVAGEHADQHVAADPVGEVVICMLACYQIGRAHV